MRISSRAIIIALVMFASVFTVSGAVVVLRSGSPNNSIEVVITDDGFIPSHLRISKGTVVQWVNQGQELHWPATDFHPTHTLYPSKEAGCFSSALDACRGLKAAESFTFQFDHTGRWGMHDHLFPGLTMVIEVYEGTPPVLSEMSQDEVIRAISTQDPRAAWEYVKKTFIKDGEVVGNAHSQAHIVGNASYRKDGIGGLAVCDESFAFGCFHGVTEEMLKEQGIAAARDIQDACVRLFPPEANFLRTSSCVHGIGHGILSHEQFVLTKALHDCDVLDLSYRTYCYDGVFMEHAGSLEFRMIQDDPWAFCGDLSEQYHIACARYQVQRFGALGWDIAQSAKGCDDAPTLLLSETCFTSLGFLVAWSSQGSTSKTQELCALSESKNGQALCLIAAATEITFQRYGNWQEASPSICKQLSQDWQAKCFEGIVQGNP